MIQIIIALCLVVPYICYLIYINTHKHYIYVKKGEKPIGWTLTIGKFCMVRLNRDGIKETKFFKD